MSTSPAVAEDLTEALADTLRTFASERIDSAAIDVRAGIPRELLAELADLGVFGLSIPEDFGGMGLGLGDVCQAVAALAETDRSVATTVGLHLGLGTRGMIAFGSEALQERYLPDLATGARLAAFAATEPGAGSDLQGIATTGSWTGDRLELSGTKIFVTNGGLADVFTILASTPGLGGRRRGFSLLALERDDLGVTIGAEEHKLGIRGSSTTSVFFEDVAVDVDRVIGEPGRGMEHAGHVLAWGRTAMAAGCTGASRTALRLALGHTFERRQFGKTLIEFPLVRRQLADLSALQFAMEALVRAAGAADRDALVALSTAAKVLCSEGNWEIVDRAVQLHGGSGFIEETGIPLLLRDARITRIFEGANDVLLFHLGAMCVTSRGARAPLAPSDGARAADALAGRLEAWMQDRIAAHGLKLLRRQDLLHRIGQLRVLSEASDSAVRRARELGTVEAADLAAHWVELASDRADAVLAEPPDIDRIERIAARNAAGAHP